MRNNIKNITKECVDWCMTAQGHMHLINNKNISIYINIIHLNVNRHVVQI